MPTVEKDLRELLSYRLARLANTLSRSAASRLRRQFGIGLGEWRTIGLIGTGELSTGEIARQANLDKGQVSRIVASLVERDLVKRGAPIERGRPTKLFLTSSGMSLYRSLMGVAGERDATLRAALTTRETQLLTEVLAKLQGVSLLMLRTEEALNKAE